MLLLTTPLCVSSAILVSPDMPLQRAFDESVATSSTSTLFLAPGVHRLQQPLQLKATHSKLRVVGLPGSSISGGATITGWKQHPFEKTILQASVATILDGVSSWPRNMWIGGRRAERSALAGALWTPWTLKGGYEPTDDGYHVHSLTPLLWRHASSVEMVYTAQGSQWSESRCTVAAVEPLAWPRNASVLVRMKQPCWFNVRHKPCGQGTSRVASIENAGILKQLQRGEWYLDFLAKTVYYAPLAGERASDLEAVLPITNGLIHAAAGVSSLSFVNVTFEHDMWAQPNGGEGYVEQQSGALILGGKRPPYRSASCEACWLWAPPNGSLHFEAPRNISFIGCTFRHIGSPSAISLMGGAHGSTISSSHFYDLSGSAVQIGRNDRWAPDTPVALRESDNRVTDCLIEWAATEFHGAVGVQVSHAQRTVLDRLELRFLPYGGISMGWGWARHALNGTYSSDNAVTRLSIHNFKRVLGDGGGIYALGPQPGSVMRGNWVHAMAAGRGGGAYYPDEGSTDWAIERNVFSDAVACEDRCEWLHIWTRTIRDIRVEEAWTDTSVQRNDGTNCTVGDVTVVGPGDVFPLGARAIMADAGTATTFVPWAQPPPAAPPLPLWLPMATAVRAIPDAISIT